MCLTDLWMSSIHTFRHKYLLKQQAYLDQFLWVALLASGIDYMKFWDISDSKCCYHGNKKGPIELHCGKCCSRHSTFSFDWNFFKLAGIQGWHKISFSKFGSPWLVHLSCIIKIANKQLADESKEIVPDQTAPLFWDYFVFTCFS